MKWVMAMAYLKHLTVQLCRN